MKVSYSFKGAYEGGNTSMGEYEDEMFPLMAYERGCPSLLDVGRERSINMGVGGEYCPNKDIR